MKVKIKLLNDKSVVPTYAYESDACVDLTATSVMLDNKNCWVYGTGIALEIPNGYVGLVFPRSSLSKKDLLMSNSVGVIDSGYRGEIKLKFYPRNKITFPDRPFDAFKLFFTKNHNGSNKELTTFTNNYYDKDGIYEIGDRIGQLMIIPRPRIQFEVVDELKESERGTGGYGSTGK